MSCSFYVSPDGDDSGEGSMAAPFATLERARDAIRALKSEKGLPPGVVAVVLRAGEYELKQTFELTSEDSGSEGSRIVYRACSGEEVRVSGGRRIPASAFEHVRDAAVLRRIDAQVHDKLLMVRLGALGLTDCGDFPERFRGAAPILELFFNDERMTLARWPNEGWATVGKVIDRGSVPRQGDQSGRPGAFEYTGDRPSRWYVADGVWLNGYWCFDWYDETIKVKSIDVRKRTITFSLPHHYGIGGRRARRYYATNLFEELDRPGEYYVDRKAGVLYFWPPAPLGNSVVVSVLKHPLISLENVSHVTIRGLTLECCRGTALSINEGRENRVEACLVRNTGQAAMRVSGGRKHVVEACDIHDTGTIGVILHGGDRRKLLPAGHEAVNNHIYRFSRRQRTYASAIQVSGVGNRVAHNLMHDAPHQAIGLSGNDHVIEYNVIHHVCMETDDCGAFYMGRNPSNRGTVIRYNFWHHIGSPLGHGNNAVYFDDGDGGQTVFGNVFFRCGEPGRSRMGAVFCHGGHDNLVDNNVFVECKRAIGASPWNDKRWYDYVKADLWQTRLLKEVDITKPPYTTRYPQLVGFMDPPSKPRMNRAVRNVVVMCADFMRGNYTVEDNFETDCDPGFVDAASGDFTLREDSLVFDKIKDFQPIPLESIGLRRNALRPTLTRQPWTYGAPAQAREQ